VIKLNEDQRNFRIFGPDETLSTVSAPFLKSPTVNGMPVPHRTMSFSRPKEG